MERVFAIVLLAGLVFQLGAMFGIEKDPRPMTPSRAAGIAGGLAVVVCGVALAVIAL